VAADAAHITEIGESRDGLDGLDDDWFLLSRKIVDQVGQQGDLERHRRLQDGHEFVGLLQLIEHRRQPFRLFGVKLDDSIIADDKKYRSAEPGRARYIGIGHRGDGRNVTPGSSSKSRISGKKLQKRRPSLPSRSAAAMVLMTRT
jgi:hypothetical protein